MTGRRPKLYFDQEEFYFAKIEYIFVAFKNCVFLNLLFVSQILLMVKDCIEMLPSHFFQELKFHENLMKCFPKILIIKQIFKIFKYRIVFFLYRMCIFIEKYILGAGTAGHAKFLSIMSRPYAQFIRLE